MVLCLGSVVPFASANGQSEAPPYRRMEIGEVSFEGPGRGPESDLVRNPIRIGLILPLEGAQAAQGRVLLVAAQTAVREANEALRARGVGVEFELAVRNQSEQWGQASNAIVQLIAQEEVVALVTPLDGKIAHQAEQIVNKLGVPVLTLSSDPTTTRINIPWIFRLALSDREQAEVIAQDINRDKTTRKILLIAESGYDGRIGGDEFVRSATSHGMAAPVRQDVSEEAVSADTLVEAIDSCQADAVVVWGGSRLGGAAALAVSRAGRPVPLYLSGSAAGFLTGTELRHMGARVAVRSADLRKAQFIHSAHTETDSEPVLAAEQMDLALRSVIGATEAVGANRARLRDYLASGAIMVSGPDAISFDPAGNLVVLTGLFEPGLN